MTAPPNLSARHGQLWRNWARSTQCAPQQLIAASSDSDIVDAIKYASDRGLTLRAAGTGHSFNSIATTDGVLLDMTGYSGIVSLDSAAPCVTVRGGTTLNAVNRFLDGKGLALGNMGTLEDQTIAGALSTGNHGSGLKHGAMCKQVIALTLATAKGELRHCTPEVDADLFRAAVTSLGALGVIVTVTLRCVPKFNLRVIEGSQLRDQILEDIEAFAGTADHASFSLKAWTDKASTLKLVRTDAPVSATAPRQRRANTLGEVRCSIAAFAGSYNRRALHWIMTSGSSTPVDYVDVSYKAFTFPQPVRQLALEYALPLATSAAAVHDAHEQVKRFGLRSPYSITVRFSAGDDILLSPAHGRATAYVNITVPCSLAYVELLRVFESVMREHKGRPHWGKAHTIGQDSAASLYPGWQTFQDVRAALDPNGIFSSDYIKRVLGGVRGT